MTGVNRYPLLGWHAAPDVAAWVRAEAKRRSVPIAEVLNEAVRQAMGRGVFTCPQCGRVNRDHLDVRERFCVWCGEVTDPERLAELRKLVG